MSLAKKGHPNKKKPVIRYSNRRARRDYFIAEKIEAGVVLSGAEVKSVKTKSINLDLSLVQIKKGEVFIVNAHIPPYQFSTDQPYDPRQSRKLLLKKNQIKKLIEAKHNKLAIVPLSCYNKGGWIKVLLGIGKRKKKYEKKQILIERTLKKRLKTQPRNI